MKPLLKKSTNNLSSPMAHTTKDKFKSIFYILILVCFSNCKSYNSGRSISNNISESKQNGFFIAEYVSYPNPSIINDTISIYVSSAWLEYQWGYSSDYSGGYPTEGYQLIVEADPKDLEGHSKSWQVGIGGDRYLRPCAEGCLVEDFDTLPQDTITWKVQAGLRLDPAAEKVIIGKFVLVKKSNKY